LFREFKNKCRQVDKIDMRAAGTVARCLFLKANDSESLAVMQ